uniref:ATP synthase subunit a n=1 Tax=Brentisentis yangtzensis TaxID=2604967 RepID=A0A5B9RUG9_9BILA|nr:ATP synthase F0 subunit 6 [Brentisentis yangtzensis]
MMVLFSILIVWCLMFFMTPMLTHAWGFLFKLLVKVNYSALLFLIILIMILILNLSSLVYSNMFSMMYGLVGMFGFSVWFWGVLVALGSVSISTYTAHFCIEGVPFILSVVLPTLELFSVIIRPLTLSVRLATNITSGHVLLLMFFLFMSSGATLIMILPFLWILEICVAMLQAFIFSTLVEMYQE